ncbi:MAG: hypothetical protein U1F68_18955 [Gammaproteobacteria bacterium]
MKNGGRASSAPTTWRAESTTSPQKRLEAIKLVKQGKTMTIGMPYQAGMPLIPGRTYAMRIPAPATAARAAELGKRRFQTDLQ